MSFIDRLFGKGPKSGNIAKERLQLVLLQDRVKLHPATMDLMRDEIINVISNYVDIDRGGVDFALTEMAGQNCLVANIPVLRSKTTVQ